MTSLFAGIAGLGTPELIVIGVLAMAFLLVVILRRAKGG